MCFSELSVDAGHQADQDLTYLCVGPAGDLHLAHQITASPDFDQVLTARLVPGTVTDPAGRLVTEDVTSGFDRAVPVRVRGRSDTSTDRLIPNLSADGFLFTAVGPTGSHGFGVQVETGPELYVELRELGSE